MALGLLIGFLYLTAFIPRTAFRENLLLSAEYLYENESEFYRLRENDRRTEIHNYADVITFNIMYSIEGEDLWDQLMMSPFYSDNVNGEYPMIWLLKERIEGEKQADTIYDRYWHGSMLLLRPLFCVFTITQIRVLMLVVSMGLLLLLSIGLWKKKQKSFAVSLWIAAIMTGYPMVSYCVEYFMVWLIMLGISLAAMRLYDRIEAVTKLVIISGVCCAFFDFLTTETVALVIPLAIVCCLRARDGLIKNFMQGIKWVAWWCFLWVISYLGTLGTKWSLSSLVIGQERFSTAIAMMLGRQGAETIYAGNLSQPMAALLTNLRLMFGLTDKVTLEGLMIGVLLVAGALSCVIYLFRKSGKACVLPGLLFVLGCIPVVRILVLNNHSLEHCFFVYRALFSSIVCAIIGIAEVMDWSFIKKFIKRG